MVGILLEQGADRTIKDDDHNLTAGGWASHAERNRPTLGTRRGDAFAG